MRAYRYLTGKDDSAFCHRVTEMLNRGCELYGSPTLTYDAERKMVMCGQAVVKDVPDRDYEPGMALGEL